MRMRPFTASTAATPTAAGAAPASSMSSPAPLRKARESATGSAGSYFLGSSTFSVYEEMARQLREEGWRRKTEAAIATADFILGDRFRIPYTLLRVERMARSSWFGGTRWVNYFEGSHRLTLKAAMVQLMKEVDTHWATWLPESYAVGGDQLKKADERRALLEALAAAGDDDAVWIVKPSSGAKGRHILLLRASAVPEWLERLPESSKSMYVVQRYVDRPLLLSNGRKFDIRVWALLVSPYSIYAYTQVSCRTASEPYDLSDITNTHVHLTNHCLQKDAAHFGEYEEENEMWLPQLQSYLTSIGKPADLLETRVLPAIKELLVRTLLAVMPEMAVPATEAYKCFQLFGYDMILTEEADVRLLEINGSPGVAERFLTPLVRSMRELLGAGPKDGTGSTTTTRNCDNTSHEGFSENGSSSNSGCASPTSASSSCPGRRRTSHAFSAATSATGATRNWRLEDEGFVLLWRRGDAVPPGLVDVC
ncbi:tubulin-tyrosine ligase-like protein [Leishmania major strain Friedlin]|uniref:Tubulin--tyrosine ligase n=1 Tax=Leishmania major TaxID=5664 RepID=E9ACW9_LEIMA|nr:tubulin-tyrosine ligase-like protein [Leishmania major strain Friedlin]CAG9576865.1 tubulin-tyrosine_ligase-like_protein [Leishmania major strain Friedlin]CBZ12322.1 tubulin-tyrosine ligase-like protein [Leishmania major strain Friedlin]|eukprot:XP_003722061.1 tubulin-tyrosine ligase-like protein [Leishmania major strain Friedlin]